MAYETTASPEFGHVLKPEEQARKKIDEMLADGRIAGVLEAKRPEKGVAE